MNDLQEILVDISEHPLSLDHVSRFVADPAAGAIATFTGVTRNTFNGKEVVKLEYEAYVPMALKKMQALCIEVKQRWTVKKIAIVHRTGTVSVGESSVVIAVSSAHRRAALEACAWAIDELKAVVPIWKKEFFVGGEVWKENAESRLAAATQSWTDKD